MRLSLAFVLRLAACVTVLGLAACDPAGPGAAGTIALPTGTTTTYPRVEIRAFPDDGGAFNPLLAPIDDANTLYQTIGTTGPAPWAYEVSEGFGGSSFEHWRIVAWLASDSDGAAGTTPARIPPGTRYGTRTFTVDGCGIGVDGYCGTTDGVDLVLDQIAPE